MSVRCLPPSQLPSQFTRRVQKRHLLLVPPGLAFGAWEKVCISVCWGGEVGGLCE